MGARIALTIGNFDGVHLGHAALIGACREAVGPSGQVVAVTFEPHPIAILRPADAQPRLATPGQRRAWLEAAGADVVETLPATRELLDLPPERFVSQLVERHRPEVVVEGPDFRFGRSRTGTLATLRELGRAMGFRVMAIDAVETALVDGAIVRVSSSLVRWTLGAGRVVDAGLCLGRAYELEGAVVRGEQRGRTIGFPTANLDHGDRLLPADGVYAGHAILPDGRRVPAAISIGTKPTFAGTARVCEAHLVDHVLDLDDYGWTLRLTFERWMRDQLSFSSLEALVAQIGRDVEHARSASSGSLVAAGQ